MIDSENLENSKKAERRKKNPLLYIQKKRTINDFFLSFLLYIF
jgi:hypothetical protein